MSNTVAHYFNSSTLTNLIYPTPYYHLRFENLEEFLKCTIENKIAFFHIDTSVDISQLEITVRSISSQVTKLVFVCTELHDWKHFPIIPFIKSFDYSHVDFYVSGILNFQLENANVYNFFNWLVGTAEIYKTKFPELLDCICQDTQIKPYRFDALLGIEKDHRTFIYNQINSNPILKQNTFMTYHFNNKNMYENIKYILEPEMNIIVDNPTYSMYFGEKMLTNMIIPKSIYSKTQYSIVAETAFSNDFSQFTEKIAKPILSERLFIVFSGQHYLKNLRSLGFKTFDNVIDESYDSIKNSNVRWHAVFKQIQILARQDPNKILNEIQSIVKHNKKLLLSMRWEQPFSTNYL